MAGCGFNGLASMPGYEQQSGFDFNRWLQLQWLDFDAWLRATKWLRLLWLAAASMAWLQCLATSCKMASASMADCGFKGMTSMPGYELQKGFGFNGWLWLQWLGFDALLRAAKWLRL
jgi:hypothetical protein